MLLETLVIVLVLVNVANFIYGLVYLLKKKARSEDETI